MFLLFYDDLDQVCEQIYAVLFAISCKIVMSKYNLLISLSVTHSSMITCNCPHPDHAQVNVGHIHTTDMLSENMMSSLRSEILFGYFMERKLYCYCCVPSLVIFLEL